VKITKPILLIFTCLLFGCKYSNTVDESKELSTVLTDYFAGIEKNDLNKMNQHTTSDFLLFESGKVWNNDSLFNDLKNYADTRIEFKLDNFKTLTNGAIGHIAYFNHGYIYKNDTLIKTIDWTENAVFKKVNNQWKICFLQSTPMAKH
jgi:hypothetical protein